MREIPKKISRGPYANLTRGRTRILRASYAHPTRILRASRVDPTQSPRNPHASPRNPSWPYAHPHPGAWDLGPCALAWLWRAIANPRRRVAMCIRKLSYSEPKAVLPMPKWLDALPIEPYTAALPLPPPPPLSLPGGPGARPVLPLAAARPSSSSADSCESPTTSSIALFSHCHTDVWVSGFSSALS